MRSKFPPAAYRRNVHAVAPKNPDTLFEKLLQDLPSETVQMARAFKAFVRAKKVKTPAQLLRGSSYIVGWTNPCAR